MRPALAFNPFPHQEKQRRAQFARHARRCGLSVGEYMARRAAGLKRCPRCALWKPVAAFGPCAGTHDKCRPRCRDCPARDCR